MRRVTRNGVLAVAASGALAVTLPAYAAFAADGAGADGSATGSPGLIAGNTVQLPVDVPVNVCGDTVDVVGLLNPAAGNRCANDAGSGARHRDAGSRGTDRAGGSGGATAKGGEFGSPGVLSGNGVQLPVHLPVNVTGNSVNVVGIGNPATGNESSNGSTRPPAPPEKPAEPAPAPKPAPPTTPRAHPRPAPPAATPQLGASLAHTGADQTLPALAGGAALIAGGAILYRRFRPGAR
ncbi:chaplin [Streptomyces sp. NPDC003717]|uniref:chaplin n=1 Tax=Streptomyces sp. NPDC003717 TaxID=3154276 RepID=UPI0033BB5956